MTSRPDRILAIGAVVGALWVLFVTVVVHLPLALKVMGGGAVLFVIIASTITLWLAVLDHPIPWIRDPDQPQPPQQRYVSPRRDEHQEYLMRRAEDARMRSLVNPHSQQAPPTDWFGR